MPPSSRSPRNATLATIHPDGHGLRLRLNTGADSGSWSPDGKRIACRCRSGTSKLNGTGFRRSPSLGLWGPLSRTGAHTSGAEAVRPELVDLCLLAGLTSAAKMHA
jgi:hypothetical protein